MNLTIGPMKKTPAKPPQTFEKSEDEEYESWIRENTPLPNEKTFQVQTSNSNEPPRKKRKTSGPLYSWTDEEIKFILYELYNGKDSKQVKKNYKIIIKKLRWPKII